MLDLELASDTVMEGTPALELLCYYLARGKAVVALGRPGERVSPFPGERVALVSWPAERQALLRAVADLAVGQAGERVAAPA